jgi:hypothetical protein
VLPTFGYPGSLPSGLLNGANPGLWRPVVSPLQFYATHEEYTNQVGRFQRTFGLEAWISSEFCLIDCSNAEKSNPFIQRLLGAVFYSGCGSIFRMCQLTGRTSYVLECFKNNRKDGETGRHLRQTVTVLNEHGMDIDWIRPWIDSTHRVCTFSAWIRGSSGRKQE